MTGAEDALVRLAELLRRDPVIAPHVREPLGAEPALGVLAASGPRAASDRGDYSLMFEAIREGYLLHFGEPRLIADADADLRLLAGDYLYALGLEHLAAHGDLPAVRELGDLISLSAQADAAAAGAAAIDALWLAAAVAVGAGATDEHRRAKRALQDRHPDAAARLHSAAAAGADPAGMAPALARAAESVGFATEHLSDRG